MFEPGDMVEQTGRWLDATGEHPEIVMSSRVRIARNLSGHRFTHHCQGDELSVILSATADAAKKSRIFKDRTLVAMGDISTLDRQFLAERHLVSREFLFNSASRGLVFSPEETVSLMINEEDHVRVQAFAAGFDLDTASERAADLDADLGTELDMAYSERLGYLTACPTNLGTGMRASVLIHLPGLVHSKEINKLLDSLRALNHSIRGIYGEGSEVMGNFFQLSNSATLGVSEDAILTGLREMVGKVITYEQRAREMLFRKARRLLEDKVWRAYGLLRYAHTVSTKEALSLISAVRLGVGMEIVTDVSVRQLNQLLIMTQPGHLQKRQGSPMDAEERDVARAELIRNTLSRSLN